MAAATGLKAHRPRAHRRPTSWLRHRRRTPPGAPPGTLVADPHAPAPTIRFIGYGPDAFVEQAVTDLGELPRLAAGVAVAWIDVTGLGDAAAIQCLGDMFDLHRLALEDVINVHQRPKVEIYGEHAFIVTRIPSPGDGVLTEQISMFLGANTLITFQERPGDCFEPVRERIRKGNGRIRAAGADYLAYTLIDAGVDGYYPILEHTGETVEALEDRLLEQTVRGDLQDVHALKRDLLALRRALWPQREMINGLVRDRVPHMTAETQLYLRDAYDHAIQLLDMVETYREIAMGLSDLYLSAVSTRLNEVMKVLTIIATIFIPLSFLASVWGMNFDRTASPWNMPELGWAWGYPFALSVMAVTAAALVLWFRRKGWLGDGTPPPKR